MEALSTMTIGAYDRGHTTLQSVVVTYPTRTVDAQILTPDTVRALNY